jgi:phosphoglycolate phosphatase
MPRWDEYDAYLFDIDGTLLHCRDAVHYFAFCDALTAIAGRPMNLDGVVAHGNTDIGILRDALKIAAVPDQHWRPRLAEIRRELCAQVVANQAQMCAEAIEDAAPVLSRLRRRSAVLGVATGNLETIGWLKLQRAGLADYFDFGAFSDACEYRRDVFRAAVAEAQRRTHPGARICAIGDTPADVKAAHENRIDVIAVATGIYSYQELAAGNPTFCIHSFAELDREDRSPTETRVGTDRTPPHPRQ